MAIYFRSKSEPEQQESFQNEKANDETKEASIKNFSKNSVCVLKKRSSRRPENKTKITRMLGCKSFNLGTNTNSKSSCGVVDQKTSEEEEKRRFI